MSNQSPTELALLRAQETYIAIDIALSYCSEEDRKWMEKTLHLQTAVCNRLQVTKNRGHDD